MTTPNVKAQFEMLLNQRHYAGTVGNPAYGSVKDYFLETSYGKLNIVFDVIGPYRADNMVNYRNSGPGSNKSLNRLGEWIIQNKIKYESNLDLSLYADTDDEINRLHFIFAGEDQASGITDGFAWSHQSSLGGGSSSGVPDITRKAYKCISPFDGKTYDFNKYSCSPELSMNLRKNETKFVATIGTACHELSHLLLDCNDHYGSGYYVGTSSWDLMGTGYFNHLTDNFNKFIAYGSCPAHMNMYDKIRLGWVVPRILQSTENVSLLNSAENPVACIYQKGSSLTTFTSLEDIQGEFFLLENKQKRGFDAGLLNYYEYKGPLFEGGLLIYRVHKDMKNALMPNYWGYPQQFYPVCASTTSAFPYQLTKELKADESYGYIYGVDCTFGNGKNSFTDETVPSAKTILSYTTTNVNSTAYTNKPLTQIQNQNGIVTFRFDNFEIEGPDSVFWNKPTQFQVPGKNPKWECTGSNDVTIDGISGILLAKRPDIYLFGQSWPDNVEICASFDGVKLKRQIKLIGTSFGGYVIIDNHEIHNFSQGSLFVGFLDIPLLTPVKIYITYPPRIINGFEPIFNWSFSGSSQDYNIYWDNSARCLTLSSGMDRAGTLKLSTVFAPGITGDKDFTFRSLESIAVPFPTVIMPTAQIAGNQIIVETGQSGIILQNVCYRYEIHNLTTATRVLNGNLQITTSGQIDISSLPNGLYVFNLYNSSCLGGVSGGEKEVELKFEIKR